MMGQSLPTLAMTSKPRVWPGCQGRSMAWWRSAVLVLVLGVGLLCGCGQQGPLTVCPMHGHTRVYLCG